MKVQKKIGNPGRNSNQVNKNLLFKYILKSKLCQIEDILDSFKKELENRWSYAKWRLYSSL